MSVLEFFDLNKLKGNASIYESHITLSKAMMSYCENAYRVRVGVDKENREIYLFPLSKDQSLSGEYPEGTLLPISLSKTYARVCSTAMINYITDMFDIVIEKKSFVRFSCTYDEMKRAIIIKVEEGKR